MILIFPNRIYLTTTTRSRKREDDEKNFAFIFKNKITNQMCLHIIFIIIVLTLADLTLRGNYDQSYQFHVIVFIYYKFIYILFI